MNCLTRIREVIEVTQKTSNKLIDTNPLLKAEQPLNVLDSRHAKKTVNSSSQVNNYCVELEREKKENVDYCQRLTQMRFNVVTVLSTPKDNTIRVLAYQTRISLSAP